MDASSPDFESLISSHLDHARSLAKSIQKKLPPWFEFSDTLAAAIEGLFYAALKFDPARGVRFWAFAESRVRGEVTDRCFRRNSKYLNTVELVERTARSPGTNEERFDDAKRAAALTVGIESLNPRQRELVHLRYTEQKRIKDVGKLLGTSANHAAQIHREALQRLRRQPSIKELNVTKQPSEKIARIDQAKLRAAIDELGQVQERIDRAQTPELKSDLKREKELKEALKAFVPKDLKADESTDLTGDKYVLTISEQKNQRFVRAGGWQKILGWMKDRFFLHCGVPLYVLEVELTEAQQSEVIAKDHIGPRSFTTERISKIAKAA